MTLCFLMEQKLLGATKKWEKGAGLRTAEERKGETRIERGRKKCYENEHWSKRSHWNIVRTKLISQKVMSPPAQTHQGVWIKSQPGSRVGRGGLGSVGGGCNPSCSHPGGRAGPAGAADLLPPPCKQKQCHMLSLPRAIRMMLRSGRG